jgi:hypothetical protein
MPSPLDGDAEFEGIVEVILSTEDSFDDCPPPYVPGDYSPLDVRPSTMGHLNMWDYRLLRPL